MVMMRSLKRKFGISAPKVAVRPQIPGYVRWLAIAILAVLAVGLSWSMYDAGRKFAGFDKNEINYESRTGCRRPIYACSGKMTS